MRVNPGLIEGRTCIITSWTLENGLDKRRKISSHSTEGHLGINFEGDSQPKMEDKYIVHELKIMMKIHILHHPAIAKSR
jgi:peptide methionine sulfoxide reductase MsrB